MDAAEKQEIEKSLKKTVDAFTKLETDMKEENEHKIRAVNAFKAAVEHVKEYLGK